MPLKIEQLESNIMVVTYIGQMDITEHWAEYNKTIAPFCNELEPDSAHVIHHLSQIDIDFTDMIKWLQSMQSRRTEHLLAPNMKQYFVGGNQWTTSLSNWIKKQDGIKIPIFTNLHQAVTYINQ